MKNIAYVFVIAVASCSSLGAAAQQGLAALAQSGVEGPIVVVDLVKFKPDAAARYDIYDTIAEAKVKDLGGEVIFRGAATKVPGMEARIPHDEWDRVTFRKYPSMQAVMDMGSSKEYQGAFPNRLASVEKSFVYAYTGELPSFTEGSKPGMHPMSMIPKPATTETVYMLNLLRFKKDGGERKYFLEYGAPRDGFRPDPVLRLKGVGAVIPMEDVDRLILVRYPSVEVFKEMVTSPVYREISHLRTEAIELGLIWPFAMITK